LVQAKVRLFTSDYVLDETLTRLRYDHGWKVARDFYTQIETAERDRLLTLLQVDRDVWNVALDLLGQYADQDLSVTDCTSVVLAQRVPVDEMFAFDHHFHRLGLVVQPACLNVTLRHRSAPRNTKKRWLWRRKSFAGRKSYCKVRRARGKLNNMDMENLKWQALILIQALPYIREFAGAMMVVKYGGAAMENAALKEAVMTDLVLMRYVGIEPIVVHGGGPELSQLMKRLGKQPEFQEGRRVTDAETMELAEMVFGGKLNKEIVALLNRHGGKAVGLTGKDANLFVAEKKTDYGGKMLDLGFVGEIKRFNTDLLRLLVAQGYIPVIAPIGVGEDGTTYNINADTVAGQLAAELKAKKMIMLTDVRGLLRDKNDENTLISKLTVAQARDLLASGRVESGMIPKLESCLIAAEGGVERVHILDGRIPHSILIELFSDTGIGTMIEAGEAG